MSAAEIVLVTHPNSISGPKNSDNFSENNAKKLTPKLKQQNSQNFINKFFQLKFFQNIFKIFDCFASKVNV